jgi:hypothetical protein
MDNCSPSPEPDSLAALHEQDARHFRAMFLGLADLGAEMAQVIAQRVKDEAYAPATAPTQLPALVNAYDTMLRSLRRTALLVQKFTAPPPAPRHAGPGSDSARKPGVRRGGDLLDRDAPVDLSKLSDAELDELDRLDRLEGVEGLESGDELAGRPLRAVIAAILRDLGVVAAPPGVEPMTRGPADSAGWTAREQSEDRAEAHALRRNGATGCRDP